VMLPVGIKCLEHDEHGQGSSYHRDIIILIFFG